MRNLVPQAPSDASKSILQDRFNRDVSTSIRQMKDEIEARLSKVEKDLEDLIEEWREFYDVEWHEQKLIITSNTNRISALESAVAALESAVAALQVPPPIP